MYEIYDTKAYILKTLLRRENDQGILLFTKDFGLIWASVSGSKKESSKMRNFLQDLTFCKIFLVQGKSGYRITGGKFIENIYFSLREKDDKCGIEKIKSIKNILNLFEKIFHKGEKDENIFALLENFISDLKEKKEKEPKQQSKEHTQKVEELEVIFLSKIFFLLGYLDEKDLLEKIGESNSDKKNDNSRPQIFSEEKIKNLRKKINENISKVAF
jgi:recombinational DNA repair protein (RecF pathway)